MCPTHTQRTQNILLVYIMYCMDTLQVGLKVDIGVTVHHTWTKQTNFPVHYNLKPEKATIIVHTGFLVSFIYVSRCPTVLGLRMYTVCAAQVGMWAVMWAVLSTFQSNYRVCLLLAVSSNEYVRIQPSKQVLYTTHCTPTNSAWRVTH